MKQTNNQQYYIKAIKGNHTMNEIKFNEINIRLGMGVKLSRCNNKI